MTTSAQADFGVPENRGQGPTDPENVMQKRVFQNSADALIRDYLERGLGATWSPGPRSPSGSGEFYRFIGLWLPGFEKT